MHISQTSLDGETKFVVLGFEDIGAFQLPAMHSRLRTDHLIGSLT
jgi:hypothetical protein